MCPGMAASRGEDAERSAVEVGNRIREEREGLGISQEELARRIFVSRQTVSNWETGKTYPDVQSLLLLSNLFGASVDSLVKGDVEAMQEEMENYELDRFKIRVFRRIALALLAVGAVMLAVLVVQGERPFSPLFVLALVLLAAGTPFAHMADRVERSHDIDTVREVKAFLDGVDPDQIERDRETPRAVRIAARTLTAVGIALAFIAVASAAVALAALG